MLFKHDDSSIRLSVACSHSKHQIISVQSELLKYGIQSLYSLVLLTLSNICQMYTVVHAFMYSH